MGIALIMLTVTFTFKGFEGPVEAGTFADIPSKSTVLTLSYAVGLLLHFFVNNRFRTANPGGELILGFAHVLFILALLQVLTMHLIPKYPSLNQAVWVTVALVVIKFLVDSLFLRINKPFQALVSRK